MELAKGEIVAILRNIKPESVCEIANVLHEEGIKSLEVSLSDAENGLKCLRSLIEKYGDSILIGVGTVVTREHVDAVVELGVKYIITPGWDRELVRYIKSKNMDVIPGVFTPGDIMQAISEGIDIVKLFPADALGISYIKSLRGPFPNVKLMAVGGVSKNNMLDFYHGGYSYFGIGSELVPRNSGHDNIDAIRQNAREFMNIIKRA